ncbi:MAG: rRNA cytosine-C5-methylase [Rikenella sp.]|nr:rRNA cytosine-C5-methylase [Rikenella sp.]
MAASENNRYVPLPAAFVESVGSALPGLVESLDAESPVSVRFNPRKPVERLPETFSVDGEVAWAEPGEAIYLTERPIFTADPAFHGGAYYVQEAGSMFVGRLLRRLQAELPADLRLLDLCASPGGKTTHLASIVGERGVVVGNEVIRARAKTLVENVQKWGTGNVAVVSNDPAEFGERLPSEFDVVVVDAPCSGEGMFRKDYGARAEWSSENVRLCAARQRRIVSDVWAALRPGGVLIYSTCTFNAAENEENVRWVADTLGGEVLAFGEALPAEGIVPGLSGGDPAGWHFYPHRVRSEGFFAAAIRKTGFPVGNGVGESSSMPKKTRSAAKGLTPLSSSDRREAERWLVSDSPALDVLASGRDGSAYGFSVAMADTVNRLLDRRFNLLYSGVQLGEMIRGTLKPAHTLALYHALNRSSVPVAELSETAAREFLRKGTSTTLLPTEAFGEGLNLVVFNRIALGWVKRIGRRYNNLYPSTWRILHY